MTTPIPCPEGQVLALRATPQPIRWLNLRETVVLSMWFVPGLFVAGAAALCAAMLAIDHHTSFAASWLPAEAAGSAETLASAVAGGMLTFTAVVFSTTLVAIQLAGGQYSPRVVRVFVRSTLTHVTLGVFLATFTYSIGALLAIRDGGSDQDVPTLTIVVLYALVAATLTTFIAFAHGIVRLLRVQYLLRTVTAQGQEAIERFVPRAEQYEAVPAPQPAADARLVRNGHAIGLLMSIDMNGLAEVGARAGGWVEMLVEPGEYVGVGTPVARVHGGGGDAPDAAVLATFLVGGERTLIQDPGFGLRQIVDIACRALSAAINDPTTAVQAIDRLTTLMATVAERPDPSGWYTGADGVVRVRVRQPGFARLATLAYTEISLFGAGSPQVTRRLLAAYDVLEGLTDGERRQTVVALRARTLAAMDAAIPGAYAEVARTPDRLGFG